MRFPTHRPTPSEYAVIAVVIAGLLISFGMAGVAAGFFAAPEKHLVARALIKLGGTMLGLGILVAVAYWAVRRFMN